MVGKAFNPKLLRVCPRCGSLPHQSCMARRGGRYSKQGKFEDGGYVYRLKKPHKER